MFRNSNLFAIMQTRHVSDPLQIKRLSLAETTRIQVMELFSENVRGVTHCEDGSEKTPIPFCADYTVQPDCDEFIEITDYDFPDEIEGAICNPASVDIYEPRDENLPTIRALFVGVQSDGSYLVAFQRFKPAQYLRASSVHIVHNSNTFVDASTGAWEKITRSVGLTIQPVVDVVFEHGSLCFVSQYYAKQILDLSGHYVEAGRAELEAFAALPQLTIEDKDLIVSGLNSWERRKIASIQSSRIIEEHPLEEMLGYARDLGYELPVSEGRLVIPLEKSERKKLLEFLDEDVYRGMFTGSVYSTNSKRTV